MAGTATLVLLILLFRPEEEVEAGEDAGAYFNVASSYARHGLLHFPDPGMAAIPAEERFLFRYGHAGFLITKDAVLWAADETFDEVGPHFFPGYSLLLAVPMALGHPYAAFWVSPILAIMIGLLLALLARWLTGRPLAGWLAFALYMASPIIVWNARCLRAEWPASFLALGGVTLWVAHVGMGKRVSPGAAFLAGWSLAGAALFHVTAAYVLIPAMVLALCIMRWRPFWMAWWCGVISGLGLFVAHLVWISDPYRILDHLLGPGRRLPLVLALLLLVAGITGLRVVWTWFRTRCSMSGQRVARILGGVAGILFAAGAFYLLSFRSDQGHLPGLPAWTEAYISLTDFEGVHRMTSRVALFFALAGVPVLCSRSGAAGRLGRTLFLVLAPASATIGWVFNYMFETRRMVTFLIPLLTLSSVILIHLLNRWIVDSFRKRQPADPRLMRLLDGAVPVLLAGAIMIMGVRGRAHLYTTWNYRGAFSFYQSLADQASSEGDFLFAEYTQTAVPVERLSGLPLLPIAWGYRSESEYRDAEMVFRRLVEEHPHRRYLLITPFAGIALPGLALEPILRKTLHSERMGRARRMLPDGPHEFKRTLHLHRVLPSSGQSIAFPYQRVMDGGLLGLSGTANRMPNRAISLDGVPVTPDQPRTLRFAVPRDVDSSRVWFVFSCPNGSAQTRIELFDEKGDEIDVQRVALAEEWIAAGMDRREASTPLTVRMTVSEPVHLTDIFHTHARSEVVRIPLEVRLTETFVLNGIDAQWVRAASALALPSDDQMRWLWVMATRGGKEDLSARATLTRRDETSFTRTWDLEPEWSWYLIPIAFAEQTDTLWYDLLVDPPWDPELGNFPSDLGLLIHRLYMK